jgi:hypothetical protein
MTCAYFNPPVLSRRDIDFMRLRFALALVFALVGLLSPAAAATTTTVKPRSPGEIAEVSRERAAKEADCRRQAKAQKLSLVGRRRFVAKCLKP